jgi:hypothetical protein
MKKILEKINENQESDTIEFTELNTPKSLINFWANKLNIKL